MFTCFLLLFSSLSFRTFPGLYSWGGKLRRLPESFQLDTKWPIKIAFDLWFGGNPAKGYPPLRAVEPSDVSDDKSVRKRFSDLKKLMERLEMDLKRNNNFVENPLQVQLSGMFGKLSGEALLLGAETPTGKKRREEQLAWTSYRRAEFKKSKKNNA
jgi:hypothetical protein